LSSGGDGKSPLWDEGSTGAAVGRDKVEETECGVIAVFIGFSPGWWVRVVESGGGEAGGRAKRRRRVVVVWLDGVVGTGDVRDGD